MIDPVLFGQQMAAIVREATAPLIKRIEELEAREPARGEDGKSVTPEDVAPMIAEEVAKAVAQIPVPKDGASVTVDDVAPLIREEVVKAVAQIPPPKDGVGVAGATIDRDGNLVLTLTNGEAKNLGRVVGTDGKDGEDGKDGINGIGIAGASIDRSGELVISLSNGEQKSVGVVVGRDGKDGKDGSSGKDGVGLAGASINRDGELVVTLTNGEQKVLGRVVGEDGKDGVDFTDCELLWEGERTLVARSNGVEIRKRLEFPLDRGYWREGMLCEKADIVTHGGSAWIALRETKAKPCLEAKEDWRLFARKGRDGKDGKHGIDRTKPASLKKQDDDEDA